MIKIPKHHYTPNKKHSVGFSINSHFCEKKYNGFLFDRPFPCAILPMFFNQVLKYLSFQHILIIYFSHVSHSFGKVFGIPSDEVHVCVSYYECVKIFSSLICIKGNILQMYDDLISYLGHFIIHSV